MCAAQEYAGRASWLLSGTARVRLLTINRSIARLSGLILAGGRGQRFGEIDKGLVEFRGKPMIEHALDRLRPQVDQILISANRNLDRYERYGVPIVTDREAGFLGPLAGIEAALAQSAHPLLLCVPCDSPFLPEDLAARLLEALQTRNADVAVAQTGAQPHPVFCLLRTSLGQSLRDFLRAGGRKVEAWQATVKYTAVAFGDVAHAFANINTLAELHQWEHHDE